MGMYVRRGIEERTLYFPKPYPHAIFTDVYQPQFCLELADYLTNADQWRFHRGAFFQQHELKIAITTDSQFGSLSIPDRLVQESREFMERTFKTYLSRDRCATTAHKLIRGQAIGIHNDAPSGDLETHRLVLTFDESVCDENGGHLLIFDRNDVKGLCRVIRPTFNSCVGMAFSQKSFHAVNRVTGGVRYSIVFSFWKR